MSDDSDDNLLDFDGSGENVVGDTVDANESVEIIENDDVVDDEDLDLQRQILQERAKKRAAKLDAKRKAEGKPPPKRRAKKKKQESESEASEVDEDENGNDTISSDEESPLKVRKPARGRAVIDSSDDEDGDIHIVKDDSDDEEVITKKPRAKRSRAVKDDDDDDGKKKKKKKIGIMDENSLTQDTLDAEKAERERRKRLEAKQKEFNGIELEEGEDLSEILTGTKSQKKLKSVVLDPDTDGDPAVPVAVHPSIVRILKPHQAHGIQFMYDCTFESTGRLEEEGSGGILAHCMGLGKTLQVISFLHTVMNHEKVGEKCRRVLVVVPKNVIINWYKEFNKWLALNDEDLDTITIDELDQYKNAHTRYNALHNWYNSEDPAVMIVGYDMFRILTQEDNGKKKMTKKAKQQAKLAEDFRTFLQNPGPDLIVCDEAHKLKNDESALSKTMSKIRTKRRVCLTGTPLQNNLLEYHCMVNFVKPGLLGTKQEFSNRFANIINRGRTKDASELEVRFMKRRCHVLYEHLKKCVDRKDYRVLMEAIPPKQEYVINVRLTPVQCKLYRLFLKLAGADEGGGALSKRLLPDYHMLARVWTHPYLLITHEEKRERERLLRDDVEDMDDFIADNDDEEEDTGSSSADSDESADEAEVIPEDDDGDEDVSGGRKNKRGQKKENEARSSRRLGGEDPEFEAQDMEVLPEHSGWFAEENLVTKDDEFNYSMSNKLVLVLNIIKKCEEIGDKMLIFSQSLESLLLIKNVLQYLGSTGQWFADGHEAVKAEGETWGWKEGLDFMQIDGSVQSGKRDAVQTKFNNVENLRARLMLISTRAGSLGTTMIAANRVVIFDACWNPSHDTQSLFRVYRFGQTKPVYIYRLIAQGTMEERIYKRQVTKESTSMRVVDEAQIQRHYDGNDLEELYNFTPDELPEDGGESDVMPSFAPPKDRLLADVLRANQTCIVDYFQHDTLFANVDNEKLTEDEMKDAWSEFENNKLPRQQQAAPMTAMAGGSASGYLNLMRQIQEQHKRERQNEAMRNLTQDIVFKEAMKLGGMDHDTALKIIFMKSILDQVMPAIPEEVKGGMTTFGAHFLKLIHEAISIRLAPALLLAKTINTFRTVVKMVRHVPGCCAILKTFYDTSPQFFDMNEPPF